MKISEKVKFIWIWYCLLILNKINREDLIVVCPYGIGDTYLVSALCEEVSKQYKNKSIVLIIKKNHQAVTDLFQGHIQKVVNVSNEMIRLLCLNAKESKTRYIIGHPSFHPDEGVLGILGFKGVNLLDLYKYSVFGIKLDAPISTPVLDPRQRKVIEEKWLARNLKKGIILAPEAQSIDMIDANFWENLASKLLTKGHLVYTNGSSPDSIVIKNTLPLQFSLEDSIVVAELVGTLISLRSGLCDLVASSTCKLIVLYPSITWYYGSLLEGCSLKQMELSSTVIEYEIGHDVVAQNALIDQIVLVI